METFDPYERYRAYLQKHKPTHYGRLEINPDQSHFFIIEEDDQSLWVLHPIFTFETTLNPKKQRPPQLIGRIEDGKAWDDPEILTPLRKMDLEDQMKNEDGWAVIEFEDLLPVEKVRHRWWEGKFICNRCEVTKPLNERKGAESHAGIAFKKEMRFTTFSKMDQRFNFKEQ